MFIAFTVHHTTHITCLNLFVQQIYIFAFKRSETHRHFFHFITNVYTTRIFSIYLLMHHVYRLKSEFPRVRMMHYCCFVRVIWGVFIALRLFYGARSIFLLLPCGLYKGWFSYYPDSSWMRRWMENENVTFVWNISQLLNGYE